jgi:hypothetical protein
MKTIVLMLVIASVLHAQETRREIVNAAQVPADGAKLNSDKVPDVYAVSGRFEAGTIVFTFAVVTLGVLNEEADLSRAGTSCPGR